MFRSSLFQHSLHDFFNSLRKKMYDEIDRIPQDDVLRADPDKLSVEFMDRYDVACPVLGEDISYDEPAFSPGSDHVAVTVYVPFAGEHQLLQCSGGSAPVITEHITVQPNQLVIPMHLERRRTGELPQIVGALLKRVRDGLAGIAHALTAYKLDLKQAAIQRVRERQAELADHAHTLSELRRSGFSVRRRNDGTEKVIVPVKPKVIAAQPRPAAAEPPRPRKSRTYSTARSQRLGGRSTPIAPATSGRSSRWLKPPERIGPQRQGIAGRGAGERAAQRHQRRSAVGSP